MQIEAPFRAPPGQDIDISISTKPYSYVGLMVVDQNAAALRSGKFESLKFLLHTSSPISYHSGHDLTHERLMDALYAYELSDVNTPVGSPGKESGVIIMSNTDYIVDRGKLNT